MHEYQAIEIVDQLVSIVPVYLNGSFGILLDQIRESIRRVDEVAGQMPQFTHDGRFQLFYAGYTQKYASASSKVFLCLEVSFLSGRGGGQ